MGLTEGSVCYSCKEQLDCSKYQHSQDAITECPVGVGRFIHFNSIGIFNGDCDNDDYLFQQICDSAQNEGLYDGICEYSLNGSICNCEKTGCHQDPNNRYIHYMCHDINGDPDIIDCSRDTSFPVLDTSSCICKASSCPPCGWLPTDNSKCPK